MLAASRKRDEVVEAATAGIGEAQRWIDVFTANVADALATLPDLRIVYRRNKCVVLDGPTSAVVCVEGRFISFISSTSRDALTCSQSRGVRSMILRVVARVGFAPFLRRLTRALLVFFGITLSRTISWVYGEPCRRSGLRLFAMCSPVSGGIFATSNWVN